MECNAMKNRRVKVSFDFENQGNVTFLKWKVGLETSIILGNC